ncbi:MAG: hypothetical protein AMXMBFR83_16690 [Phycisphaerae bacterium]
MILACPAGCAPRGPSLRDFEKRSPAEQQLLAAVELSGPVRLGGFPFLPRPAVTFFRDGKPVPYREADVPVRTEGGRLVFQLQPLFGKGALIEYEIAESPDQAQSSLVFRSDAPLPEVRLHSFAPPGLLPVRLKQGAQSPANRPDDGPVRTQPGTPSEPAAGRENVLSILGLALFASCDGLYDPRRDYAVAIDAPFQYSPYGSRPEVGLLGIRPSAASGREVRIGFRYSPDLLKNRFKLSTPAAGDRPPPATAPADWHVMPPDGVGPELASWLSAHLSVPGEAFSIVEPAGGLPAMIRSAPPISPPGGTAAAGMDKDWKHKLDKTRQIYGRVLERGRRYNWQHAKELLATTLEDYWSHGITRTRTAGPLYLGLPLSLEHARMWASLAALSGQGIVIGDDVRALPAERVELLRAIVPPAPIRAADLFAHALPETWVVTGARAVALAGGGTETQPFALVGVFNVSLEPRRITVRLAEAMPGLRPAAAGGGVEFAVHDFWRDRLYATTREAFEVPMPPASCRVFRILPAPPDRPELISAGPRMFPLVADARAVAWNAGELAMTGVSRVVADRPFALRFLLPESAASFEIADVVVEGGTSQAAGRLGRTRAVALLSNQDADLRWTVRFSRAALRLDPPAAPAGLQAAADTRGVLLTWRAGDEASRYRVYRDGAAIGETCDAWFQDSTAVYGRSYEYRVTALDDAGRESALSPPVGHRMPLPAAVHLSELEPLVAEQEHLGVTGDASAAGNPLTVAGRRYPRGLGTHSRARIVYYLGGGYRTFTGAVGIDDETAGKGSCAFIIRADGEALFTSEVLRGGAAAQPFSVSVAGRMTLELIVTDGGDNPDNDHADWLNLKLEPQSP